MEITRFLKKFVRLYIRGDLLYDRGKQKRRRRGKVVCPLATNNNSNGSDWGGWIPIIILFCIPFPVTWIIALCMLVTKLRGGSWRGYKRHPYDMQRDQAGGMGMGGDAGAQGQGQWQAQYGPQDRQRTQRQSGPRQERYNAQRGAQQPGWSAQGPAGSAGGQGAPSAGGAPVQKRPRGVGGSPGTGLIIGGATMSGIFSLGFLATAWEFLRYGGDPVGAAACLAFLAGGLGMLFSGIGKNRRAERYANYLSYIGANREVDLARMSASFGIPVKKLCKDLRRMLARGILPNGYLDLAEGRLYLSEMGYHPREPERKAPEPQQTQAQAAAREDAILREIRQVNDDIPDAAMSAKIDRIEEITRKILAYQKQHPDRESQLRTFLNYYLPTTLKILRAYAQLEAQGIEGENISAAKGRIEGMMDQVVAGFEKQLDKLFQDDAMDIASDVEVLENMLKKDGLSGGNGVTLGL